MDDFFKDENIVVFQKWLYFQLKNDTRIFLEKYAENTFQIQYKNKKGRIVIWSMGIIEETIESEGKILFYLHFQLRGFGFAKDMYKRMIDKLVEDIEVEERDILLCCTGGMTTSFFAEKMNKYCHLNQMPYHIFATAVYNLDDVYKNYDLILLAPQLRYKIIELSPKYKPTILQSIEPVTFATYDCQSLLEQIENFYKEKFND